MKKIEKIKCYSHNIDLGKTIEIRPNNIELMEKINELIEEVNYLKTKLQQDETNKL